MISPTSMSNDRRTQTINSKNNNMGMTGRIGSTIGHSSRNSKEKIDLFAIDYETRATIIRKLMNLEREEHAKQFTMSVEEEQKKKLDE